MEKAKQISETPSQQQLFSEFRSFRAQESSLRQHGPLGDSFLEKQVLSPPACPSSPGLLLLLEMLTLNSQPAPGGVMCSSLLAIEAQHPLPALPGELGNWKQERLTADLWGWAGLQHDPTTNRPERTHVGGHGGETEPYLLALKMQNNREITGPQYQGLVDHKVRSKSAVMAIITYVALLNQQKRSPRTFTEPSQLTF